MNITYCANGCKTTIEGQRIRIQTEAPSNLCRRCENNLHDWLEKIPNLYALLPGFIVPGSVDQNPESKATKRAEAVAPVRLDVIDLLDTRLGRMWQGIAPAHDRRGVVGTLLVQAERLVEERPLTTATLTIRNPTVTGLCALLDRNRLWLFEQDWAQYLYDDVKQVHRSCSDAVGEYRRPPVGHCHIETDTGACGGPLFASTYGGVRCARCQATWDADHLRQLGLAQAAAKEEEPA